MRRDLPDALELLLFLKRRPSSNSDSLRLWGFGSDVDDNGGECKGGDGNPFAGSSNISTDTDALVVIAVPGLIGSSSQSVGATE